ncbi:MAG TPA: VOC family protein [Alphaproteobacteria bacterium]|nr:VOC family protein [Alphaproteobacteria bacterium]
MLESAVLEQAKIVAFVGTRQPERAKSFYRDTLGLKLVGEDPFAIVFDANGTMLRVSIVPELTPAKFTVLGWQVADIAATSRALQKAGVALDRFPGLQQDELGIWSSPSGANVAWFKDPDGNILSITEL